MGKIARNSFLTAAMLASAGLLFSSATLAAGLGRLTVLSALGEPLKAEIEIVSLQPGEVDTLSAKLAPNEAYRQASIELNGALIAVKFAVEPRSGKPVVTLNSVQPMNEPFIDMLIELNWSGGRLVREYTFLLDPPEYKAPAAVVPAVIAPVVVPNAPTPPVTQPTPAPQPASAATPAPVQAAERPVPAPAAKSVAEPKPKSASYELKRGDTLAGIAHRNMVEGATLQQMLVALYRGNPDAFDGENMNRLRAGRILNLPEKDAVTSTAVDEARRVVGAQSADYARYRSSLGAAVAAGSARPETGRQASGKIGAPAEEKPAPSKEAPKDQLRLSRAEDAKAGGKAAAAAAADDKVAKEKAVKEANERAALLEKNVAEMKKVAELKSQAAAQLQKQAEAAKAAPAAKAEAPKAEAPKAEAAKAAPAAEPAKAEEAPKAEAPKPAAPKPAPVVVPPPPEPSFIDELLDNPAALGGGGAVVILLAGYAFYAVRKKRKAAAAANSVMDIEPSIAASALGAAGGASIDTSASQADSSAFSVGSAATTDSEEIDPIAEADVYMAYGRDAQAEEILKEALASDGSRLPVRLKLLEIYANRKDVASFETNAREIHTATGGQGADWEKAAALGLSIDPGNALYGGSGGAAASMADTQIIASAADAAPAPDVILDAAPAEEAAPPALDFDLDAPATEVAAEPAVEAPVAESAPSALDFDHDLGGDKPAEATPDFSPDATMIMPVGAAAEAAPAADAGLSIDFDLPTMAIEAPAAAAPAAEAASIDFDLGEPEAQPEAAAPDLNLGDISLDLGSPEAGGEGGAPSAQWQEVATKLDLAKAYQDMGDKDGARELLNEVMQEGDAAQQGQAKTMLDALG